MKYFTLDEFRCKHCGELPKNGMNPVLLQKLDLLREKANAPVVVTSGYRCPYHNRNVGGVENSQHTKGNAADIYCTVGVDKLVQIAEEVGFDGIGRYVEDGFVHVDCRSDGKEPNTYRWEG